MGNIKHHTIVVTGWQDEKLKEAHQKAKEVFENSTKVQNDAKLPVRCNCFSGTQNLAK